MKSERPCTSELNIHHVAFANTRVTGENPPYPELITSNPSLSVP